MWIKQISLKNWRAYTNAQFDMPRPKPEARTNVVVIGAKNGVGKTSLLEAITLCLFDKEGFEHLERATKDSTKTLNYGEFMNRVFSRQADMASPKTSVTIVFEDSNNADIEITRVWHFDSNRNYQEQKLFILKNGENIQIPPLADREKVLAGYVAENLLPYTLSPFFLFDSGRVQKMAHRAMKNQVQNGIQAILGVPVLRQLEQDLIDYSNKRYRDGKSGLTSDYELDKLEQKEVDLTKKIAEIETLLSDIEKEVSSLEDQRDALMQKYITLGGDNMIDLGKNRERLAQLKKEQDNLKEQIADALVDDFSMSLAGVEMLQNTKARLISENAREDWEQDKIRGAEKYTMFISNLKELNALKLPLNKDEISALQSNLKKAWDQVWFPMPDGCAKTLLNSSYSREDRAKVISQLDQSATYSVGEINNLLTKVEEIEVEMVVLEKHIQTIQGDNTEEAIRLREEIAEINGTINELKKTEGELSRQLQAYNDELARVRQEFSRQMKHRKGMGPTLHCSAKAKEVAQIIQKIIEQSYLLHVSEIGKEMTNAYVTMAHKGIVSEIELGDDCEIKLLTAEGNNLRELDPSHGESQIFSLSLIVAITRVARNLFPFVIDTPLANLDRLHRREFLRYFSSDVDNQVILLSTDEEIRKEQMTLLERHVACKLLVEQVQEDGYGRNVIHHGRYFYGDNQ